MKHIKTLFCVILLGTFAATSYSQSAPTAPKDSGWISSGAFGLTLTSGNTDTSMMNANLLSSRKWGWNELDLGISGNYGETDGSNTVENVRAFSQYNRLFSQRLFGLLRVDAQYDEIALVDYRVTVSPGLGYYFIKNTNTFLRAEVGPGFVFERVGGETEEYMTLRIAERFEQTLNERVKIWQSLEWLPSVEDFSDYVINAEIGLDSSLTKKLSLRTFVQDTYDSTPAAGRKENDLKLVVGLAYKF